MLHVLFYLMRRLDGHSTISIQEDQINLKNKDSSIDSVCYHNSIYFNP